MRRTSKLFLENPEGQGLSLRITTLVGFAFYYFVPSIATVQFEPRTRTCKRGTPRGSWRTRTFLQDYNTGQFCFLLFRTFYSNRAVWKDSERTVLDSEIYV